MVLQRNCNNCISGKASPEECVSVSFREKQYSTKANNSGQWEIVFNPGEAGGPDVLVVTTASGESLSLDSVYTGEVWLCSGQSNMQLQMNRLRFSFPEEYELDENPCVRVFTIPVRGSFVQQDDLSGGEWLSAKSANLTDMSGVSYFFAKKLHAMTGVPVGVVNASQGGSPISAWMSEECFPGDSEYRKLLEKCKDSAFVERDKAEVAEKIQKWYEGIDSCDKGTSEKWSKLSSASIYGKPEWKPFTVPGRLGNCGDAGVFWFSKEIVLSDEEAAILNKEKTWLWLGRITDADTAFINGRRIGGTPYMYPPRRYEVPAGVLHAGKNVVTVRVVLCGRSGPLYFEEEKPYMLFTDNVLTESWRKALFAAACQSEEERKVACAKGYVCIDLSGEWRYRVGCTAGIRPSEVFYEWMPTALYNGMLAPLFKSAFRGAVWYQGESNAGNAEEYRWLLKSMVELWRSKFTNSPALKDGNRLPFVIAELPACGIRAASPDYEVDGERCRKWLETADDYVFSGREDCWAAFRRMQADMAREIPDAALASFFGAGEWNDLHPEDKKTAGYKMAEAAYKLLEKSV